jgi:DNA-binding NarL/FixJ family response regulator
MRQSRTFLVVAEDAERLFLISTTLHRKFPCSVVQTCRDSEAALEVARTQQLDAIVATRSTDLDEIPLLESLRAVTSTPIVLMSDPHQAQQAMAAGAAGYLNTEQWLLVGTTVGELIGADLKKG